MVVANIKPKITLKHVLLALLLGLIGGLVTYRAWHDMIEIAMEDAEYQHIFLAPFVALFLAWVRRYRLPYLRITGTILGPIIVAVGWIASSYGFNNKVGVLFHIGAVFVVIGCVVSVVGKTALFRFFPAVLVLLMMVPVPGTIRLAIAQPLQRWTAEIAQRLLDVVQVQTTVVGHTLMINGQPVNVDEACNGMRLVFPLLLLGYAFAFGMPLKNSVRFGIVLISPFVALACNVLRTLPLIWLYGKGKETQALAQHLHDLSGWAMLPVAFVVLLGLLRLMKWAALPVERYTLASQAS